MQAIDDDVEVTEASELALVHAAKLGDLAAFEELIGRYDRKVFRIALHITQNRADAEDVAQETFLKAFRGLAQFREEAKFSTWLFRIAANEGLMKVRRPRGLHFVSLAPDEERESAALPVEVVDWSPNPEQLYSQSELREILARALRRLPAGNRSVFLLRDVEGLSTSETAEVLNVSVQAVKTRLLRARLTLRERLNPHFRAKHR